MAAAARAMFQQKVADEEAKKDTKPKKAKKRRSAKFASMAAMFEQQGTDGGGSTASPADTKKTGAARKPGKLKSRFEPDAATEDADGSGSAADKPAPRKKAGGGKVSALAAGLAINPAALKPGGSGPPRKKKTHALAAGLNIPMGGLRPGAKGPPRKRPAGVTPELNSDAQISKPTIPSDARKSRMVKEKRGRVLVSSVNENELKEYLKSNFEIDRRMILPEAELLSHLKAQGFDMSVPSADSTDTYDLNNWYLEELELSVSSVFGSARHQWGFHLKAKVDDEAVDGAEDDAAGAEGNDEEDQHLASVDEDAPVADAEEE